jgi:hypothetical protein
VACKENGTTVGAAVSNALAYALAKQVQRRNYKGKVVGIWVSLPTSIFLNSQFVAE